DDGRLLCLSAGETEDGVTLTRFDVSDPQNARTEATRSATGFAHTPALWYAPALYAEADGSRVGFPVSGKNQTAFRLYRWSKKAAEYREVGTTVLEYLPEESETLRLGGELYVCSAGVTYALDAKTAALLATITDAVG
ncbi:MAG: beta-propeller domain-containing protein, partial [Oscillospiraceae bacterium]|nr:beta-propeller domain-containing protein [Oscillospiraceae bacterium]